MIPRPLKCLVLIVLVQVVPVAIAADPPIPNRRGSVPNGPNQNRGGDHLVTEVEGKLKGYEQGVFIVTREDGTDVQVQPPDEVQKFQFVAEASPRFLQQGMLVRFQGTFNRAGVAQSPIAKVELFQPVNGKMPGHMRQQYYPGVYTDPQDARKSEESGIAKCSVVGSLVGIDPSGLMTVRAGKVPVQIPLVQNVRFEIRYNNLSLARAGDPVQVTGFYNPPDDTKIKAESLTVTTERVYGEWVDEEPEEKPKRRIKRRSRASKQAEGEGSPEEAESPAGSDGKSDPAVESDAETATETETETDTAAKP